MSKLEKVYSVEEIRTDAVKIYQEMIWALRDPSRVLNGVRFGLSRWRTNYEKEEELFLKDLPGSDPQLFIKALEYILEHLEEVMMLATTQTTVIPLDFAQEFGFGHRVQDTISQGDTTQVVFTASKSARD